MKKTFLLALLPIALMGGSILRAELIVYSYDGAGRLTGVNHGSGKTIAYQYDTSGNLKRTATTGTATATSLSVLTTTDAELQDRQLLLQPSDIDGDGIPDAWELAYFANLSRNASGDFDGDGFSDLSEYVAGTAPDDPNSLLRVSQNVTHDGAQTIIHWSSVPGKTYRVQYKDGIAADWNDLQGDVTATESEASKADTTSTGALRFYRVMVVP